MDRYSAIKYKVHLTPFPVQKSFPNLFKGVKLPDKVLRYIVFLYSKDSGLTQEFQSNLQERKEAAAIDAGYQKVDGKFPKEILEVMEMKNYDAHGAIMDFLKGQKHHVWTEIIVCEQELFEFQALRFASIGDKKSKTTTAEEDKEILAAAEKKEKLMKACNERIKQLEILYEQFYGDHKELAIVEFEESIRPETAERILGDSKPYEEITESAHVSQD